MKVRHGFQTEQQRYHLWHAKDCPNENYLLNNPPPPPHPPTVGTATLRSACSLPRMDTSGNLK